MCGIAGYWDRSGRREATPEKLSAMHRSMAYRGPDDNGIFIDGALGLCHRRLAILDLSAAGKQPMSTPDGRYTIVFNGEIYNYRELAQKYLLDVPLRSSSDTEVLLHLLVRRGDGILPELKGMFAFALWDASAQELVLARDPFGKKPLFYTEGTSPFAFASEVKALHTLPGTNRSLDPHALAKYFLYEYIPSPASIYRGIRQLPMGHYLKIGASRHVLQAWWRPTFIPKQAVTVPAATQRFDQLLRQAVERRLVSDVPVGIFLSGGLDSTAIAWHMKELGAAPFHSFSVSFKERSFDEGVYAKQAAESIGSHHHDIRFGLPEFHQAMMELSSLIDVPLADASMLPTYVVSKAARPQVTVVLDGDGSDELLGGYGTFTAENFAAFARPFYPLLDAVARLLPTRYGNFTFDFKIKSFVKGLPYPREERNQIWLGSFSDREQKTLLLPRWHISRDELMSDIQELTPHVENLNNFDALSYLTAAHYLHNDILVKLDRATMYNSLEARTPFLDVDLAEFVMTLPVAFKRQKRMLKHVMRGRIPDSIINRPKKGFGIPLGFWLKGPLYPWAQQVLNSRKLTEDGFFSVEVVRRLLHEHRRGVSDHRKKLWTLLSWQMWYDQWVAKRPSGYS